MNLELHPSQKCQVISFGMVSDPAYMAAVHAMKANSPLTDAAVRHHC